MIYVKDISAPVTLNIPRNCGKASQGIDLDVIGTVSRAPRPVPVGNWQAGVYYYTLDADFRTFRAGEYEYILSDSDTGEPLASGIIVLGAIPAAVPSEYNNPRYYEQYNA